jgi:N-acetylglucosamine-6-sulfatase
MPSRHVRILQGVLVLIAGALRPVSAVASFAISGSPVNRTRGVPRRTLEPLIELRLKPPADTSSMRIGLAALMLIVPSLVLSTKPAAAATPQPNVVIIMSDDQRWDTVNSTYMPMLTRLVVPNAITYTNSFVPNPLCCPSRTSTLTGDYSHTTGVFGNSNQFGGFGAFTPAPEGASTGPVNDTATLATDFQAAGYETGLVGKYLNGYPEGYYNYVPPGWDSWFAVQTGVYYNYNAAVNGHESPLYGSAPSNYATRVLANHATSFISASALQQKPFFLYFATTAPHGPATPDPRDLNRFDVSGYQQPPSWGQVGPSDPQYIQNRAWNATRTDQINAFHAHQLDSIYGVDRAIGRIWNALPDNTIVLFMSDNGFMWGEHRWSGKQVPYNESLRVPMILAGKNLTTPLPVGTDPRIVLNVDVLPTLEGLAGVTTSHPVEGMDMLGSTTRTEFVTEHWDNGLGTPTYCGVRSADWMYVQYNTTEEPLHPEGLYDENADPYEINNLAVTGTADAAVAAELAQMRSDAATLCTEGTVYPPDWPFPYSSGP